MTSTILYAGSTVTIGAFRSHPRDASFGDSGPTRNHILVFPRTAVEIQHAGREAVMADPTVVMIYNRGQAYVRRPIAPTGDHCEWFAYPADAILEARRADDADRPFGALMRVPCSAYTYALAQLARHHIDDALLVEEIAAALLDAVVGETPHHGDPSGSAARPGEAGTREHELATATRQVLAASYAHRRSLRAIAQDVGVSPFHLARSFRRATGRSIHAHRTELRIRAACERLADTDDLAALAAELGFSSHSHFTATFRTTLGVTPSQAKRDPRRLLRARI